MAVHSKRQTEVSDALNGVCLAQPYFSGDAFEITAKIRFWS